MQWGVSDSEAIARELLDGSGDRWNHVCLVAKTAQEWAEFSQHGDELVSAAWLHDVGYAAALANCGQHAIDGAEYLMGRRASSAVVSLVAFHTGAEFEAEVRGLTARLGLFARPEQGDLDLLILADLVSGPAGQRVDVAARIDESLERYGASDPVHTAIERSRPYLEACCARAAARVGYPM